MSLFDNEDTKLCVHCKYHRLENGLHLCYAEVEDSIDYVTGAKISSDPEMCHEMNYNGSCSLFESIR